jgi:hypothetical protein
MRGDVRARRARDRAVDEGRGRVRRNEPAQGGLHRDRVLMAPAAVGAAGEMCLHRALVQLPVQEVVQARREFLAVHSFDSVHAY